MAESKLKEVRMAQILTARCCGNCAAKFRDPNGLVCRRHPPSVQPVIGMTGDRTRPFVVLGFVTGFPQVALEMHCMEWSAGLGINEHEMAAMPMPAA